MLEILSFLQSKFTLSFHYELVLGIIIVFTGVVIACILANYITNLLIKSIYGNKSINKDNRSINLLLLLIHLYIIYYFVIITKHVLSKTIDDIDIFNGVAALFGPLVGGTSLFFIPTLKLLAATLEF